MGNLIAFGDSFTWGSELSDEFILENNSELNSVLIERYGKLPNKHSKLTWCSLLSDSLNKNYICHARPGSSNQSILRSFLSNADSITPDDLIVINWTWINRWDFFDFDNDEWETIRPLSTETKKSKFYFKHIHSELWDKLESLKSINIVLSYLKEHNINFLMTCVDSLLIDDEWHSPQYIQELQKPLLGNLQWFDNCGFYDWSINNNYGISDKYHPLDDAHKGAFEYARKNFKFT
jgi:hypothetical protein